jgi:tRNA pseudouridine55 synthase
LPFGFLNVDKPPGSTSHDVVAAVRRGASLRRVGHAGTLDPLARGVLILAIGQATRLTEYLLTSDKAYIADLVLGITTDTYDAEGQVIAQKPVPTGLDRSSVEQVLPRFLGEIDQVPPVYSALKVRGKPAYARVRAGESVSLKARRVTIRDIQVMSFEPPNLRLAVSCSAGTYIRSLAYDLGQVLGTGAMLGGLIRTASGRFSITDSVALQDLAAGFADGSWQDYLLPAGFALAGMPQVVLGGEQVEDIRHGRAIPANIGDVELACGIMPDGRFVAILSADPASQTWRPKKVFHSQFDSAGDTSQKRF